MNTFETNHSFSPEANPGDIKKLRDHLSAQGFEHSDDHDAVMEEAVNIFSNYAEADVIAIIAAFYKEEQDAALHADRDEDIKQ